MAPEKKANLTLAVALLLLCVSGIAAAVTIVRLYTAESLIHHTYSVEVALGDVESSLSDVGRRRIAYMDSGSAMDLESFSAASAHVPIALARVRRLISDNPTQQNLCDQLDKNANARVAPSVASVEMKRLGAVDPDTQLKFTSQVAKAAFETAAIAQEMRDNEDLLLANRTQSSRYLALAIVGILVVSFALSAIMFWIHHRMLSGELRERKSAENRLRQLSGQLMRVQDEERKKFARDLHDGLGQDIVAAKISADVLVERYPRDRELAELSNMLQNSLMQTRTISYLLHPPLLEEVGLASAAEWLIEGYTKRTGVDVSFRIPPQPQRLPRHLELTLFRILQEALTNVYRHSKSHKAEVAIQVYDTEVSLHVRDYGVGIPSKTLSNLDEGNHVGVGLSGMKERVRELGGKLEITSDRSGTQIDAKMPIVADIEVPEDTLIQ